MGEEVTVVGDGAGSTQFITYRLGSALAQVYIFRNSIENLPVRRVHRNLSKSTVHSTRRVQILTSHTVTRQVSNPPVVLLRTTPRQSKGYTTIYGSNRCRGRAFTGALRVRMGYSRAGKVGI